jgi:anti-sigma factor RsiW
MSHGAMTCKRAAELLLDYHDGTLDVDDRQELDAHLAQCATCRAFVATYKTTTSLCRKVLSSTVPADIEDRLLSFLRSKKTGKA